jgi:hypothetical protein
MSRLSTASGVPMIKSNSTTNLALRVLDCAICDKLQPFFNDNIDGMIKYKY